MPSNRPGQIKPVVERVVERVFEGAGEQFGGTDRWGETSGWYRFARNEPSCAHLPESLDVTILQHVHDRGNITGTFYTSSLGL